MAEITWKIETSLTNDNYVTIKNNGGTSSIGYLSTPSNTTEGASLITSSVVNNNSTWELERYTGSEINGATRYTSPSTFKVGEKYTFSGFMYSSVPGRNGPIKWYVKNPDGTKTDKAKIDETTGVLTALKPGEVKIWYNYDGLTYYWVITVTICYIEDGVYRMYSHSDTGDTRRTANVEKTGSSQQIQQKNRTYSSTTSNIDRYCLYKITTLPDGSVTIRTMLRSKIGLSYENVSGSNLARTADIGYDDDNTVADKNKWEISGSAATGYLLKNKQTNTYLAFSSTNVDGESLILTSSTSNNSKWRFVPYVGEHFEGGTVRLNPTIANSHVMNIGETKTISCTWSEVSFYSSRIKYNRPVESTTGLVLKNAAGETTTAATFDGSTLTALKPGTVSLYMTFLHGYLSLPINYYIQPPSDEEYFYLLSATTDSKGKEKMKCLQSNNPTVSRADFRAIDKQIWKQVWIDSNTFYLVNMDGKYLTAPVGTSGAVTMASLLTGTAAERQKWRSITFSLDGTTRFKPLSASDGYLSVDTSNNVVLGNVNSDNFFYRIKLGNDITIMSIRESYDRTSMIPNTMKNMVLYDNCNVGIHYNVITDHDTTRELLENSKIFIGRSHGSFEAFQINDSSSPFIYSEPKSYRPYNSVVLNYDLSNTDIVAFIGCRTMDPNYEYTITHAAAEAGAKIAIGTTISIGSGAGNEWTKMFARYLGQGLSAEIASEKASEAVPGCPTSYVFHSVNN